MLCGRNPAALTQPMRGAAHGVRVWGGCLRGAFNGLTKPQHNLPCPAAILSSPALKSPGLGVRNTTVSSTVMFAMTTASTLAPVRPNSAIASASCWDVQISMQSASHSDSINKSPNRGRRISLSLKPPRIREQHRTAPWNYSKLCALPRSLT